MDAQIQVRQYDTIITGTICSTWRKWL